MTLDVNELRTRFERAMTTAGAHAPGDALFAELVRRYGELHRHYHTLVHVDACLVGLDWFSSAARHPEEVELALWFHDAVYDPRAVDNERRSAELARDRLSAHGLNGPALERILRHIEATEHHVAAGGDSALLVDLDLSILGASARDFDRFEAEIRREYGHVDERQYFAGRRRVLEGFTSRREIYSVPIVREELEARARANLARRIAELSRAPAPR